MPGRRPLYAMVCALCAIVAAGTALAANGEPQKQHTARDMAKARSVVLRLGDMGTGWKASPPTGNPGGTPHCKGFQPDESDLIETGTADSPDLQMGFRFVSSTAGVFKTAAQAQASWNRVVKPGLLTCLTAVFNQGASSGKVKTTVLSQGRPAFPKLAPRAAAYRLAFSTASQGLTLNGTLDLVRARQRPQRRADDLRLLRRAAAGRREAPRGSDRRPALVIFRGVRLAVPKRPVTRRRVTTAACDPWVDSNRGEGIRCRNTVFWHWQ